MVNRVVPDDRLIAEAMAIGEKLAGWNQEFLCQTKRTFYRAVSLEPERALVVLTSNFEPLLETNDAGRTWTPLATGLTSLILCNRQNYV